MLPQNIVGGQISMDNTCSVHDSNNPTNFIEYLHTSTGSTPEYIDQGFSFQFAHYHGEGVSIELQY